MTDHADKDAEIAALKAEVARLAADKTVTVEFVSDFSAFQSTPELAQMMTDLVNGDPLNAAIARAEAAEARVAELEAGLKLLADCGSAAVGADPLDPEAQEAFDMWSAARRAARALLQKDKNHG